MYMSPYLKVIMSLVYNLYTTKWSVKVDRGSWKRIRICHPAYGTKVSLKRKHFGVTSKVRISVL